MKHTDIGKFPAAIALIGAGLIAASCSVRSAATADLSPARSFVLERATGDVAFSADLQWLAVGQTDGKVAVWDLAKGSNIGSWPGDGSIAFVSRTNVLLAEGTNLTVRELLTGQVLRRLESPTNTVNSLTISASGNIAAATLSYHSQLVFWNLADGKIIKELPTTSYPWELSDMRFGTMPLMLPISMSAGLCRAVSPDGSRFAVGQSSAQVDVWTLAGSNFIHYLGTVSGPGVYGMSTSGRAEVLAFLDNQRLAVGYNREQLSVLTLSTNDAGIMQTLPRMSFTAKTPDGKSVTGELIAREQYIAMTQLQRLGLTPITVKLASDSIKNYYYYQITNSIARRAGGRLMATNIADATAQFEKRGLRGGRILEAPDDILTVQSQEALEQSQDRSLLQKRQTLIGKPGLEIRSLAVSGDGRRLAVAGMRMAWRQGVFAPAGDGVYDVPVNAELQVWDAVEMRLLATIKGRPDEKFAQVALDETGGRVAAVTFGGTYYSKMSFAEQQGSEQAPASTRHAYLWELPSDKTGSK